MGGYDLSKISGNIKIRYANQGEPFLGLGERTSIQAASNHVIYSDDKRIICWLWNHKDSAETCINTDSKTVLFFIDSFDLAKTEAALDLLSKHLESIRCIPEKKGILNALSPEAEIQCTSRNELCF
jgi:lysyl-tRNA synthetase class 2